MPLIDPQDDDILSLDTHVVSADGNLTSQANPHFRLIHVEGISRHRQQQAAGNHAVLRPKGEEPGAEREERQETAGVVRSE